MPVTISDSPEAEDCVPTAAEAPRAPMSLYALVFVVSAATLAIQLVHMRLLSLSMWNSLVYCVITVVLLGFSVSGGVMTVWRRAASARPESLIGGAVLGFVVTNLVGVLVVGRIEIDASRAMDSPAELLKLAVYFIALGIPYFAAGLAIGAALFRYPTAVTRLYFVNMAGSGFGCLCFIAAFAATGERLMLIFSAAMCAAALPYVVRCHRALGIATVVSAMGCVALVPTAPTLFKMQICSSKNLPTFVEQFPTSVIEHSQWTTGGRVDVLGGPDLAYENKRTGVRYPMKVLLTDGDAYTRMLEFSGKPNEWGLPKEQFGSTTIYALRQPQSVAVIGIGGGMEVRDALAHGASNIVGVELNWATFEAVNSLYADYNGRIGQTPGVQLLHAEGRSYINTVPDGQFDLVYMNGVDTWAAMASGAYALAENYLYTTDAMREYFRVLKPDGAISISRYAFRTPRESLRLGITMMAALRDSGVREPWNHVAFLVDLDWGTILAKKQPFTESEIATLESLQDKGYFKIAYRPGIEEFPLSDDMVERYGKDVWHPAPYSDSLNPAVAFVKAFKAGTEESFYNEYPFEVRPCNDDSPFFFKHYKWSSLYQSRPQWAASGGSFAFMVLGVLLGVSVLALLALVFVPLTIVTKRGGLLRFNARTLGAALYFACLGVGYMTIEIVLMQKLTLFVGHPTNAITTVLCTMLIASGIGSLVSGWLRVSPRRIIPVAVILLAVFVIFMQPLIARMLPYWLDQSVVTRNIIAAFLVAPLAFVMGMPFPSGLRMVERVAPNFTPWAWGINGAAGVFASLGAIVAAMEFGFAVVLYGSVVVYCAGAVAFLGAMRDERTASANG